MIVCICKNITSSTVKEMLEYTDVEGIKQMTRAGTNCEKCVPMLYELQKEKQGEEYESR